MGGGVAELHAGPLLWVAIEREAERTNGGWPCWDLRMLRWSATCKCTS